MRSDSLVNMRVSALRPTSQLNASKRPLGTILGTVCQCGEHPCKSFAGFFPENVEAKTRLTRFADSLRCSEFGRVTRTEAIPARLDVDLTGFYAAGYIGTIPNSRGRQIGRLKLDFSRSWRWPVGMLSTYRRLRDSSDRFSPSRLEKKEKRIANPGQ